MVTEFFPGPPGSGRPGLVAAAQGGSLLLEEVASLPPAVQQGLLEALETMLRAAPGPAPAVRLICTSRRSLAELASGSVVRQSLLAQLEARQVELPPLRHRDDDIILLARHMAARAAAEHGWSPPVIQPDARTMLVSHRWPGNVRELEWVLENAVSRAGDGGEITGRTLSPLIGVRELGASDPMRSLAEVESEHVQRVLAACRGNKTRAAQVLRIDRKTLREKLKSLDVGDHQ